MSVYRFHPGRVTECEYPLVDSRAKSPIALSVGMSSSSSVFVSTSRNRVSLLPDEQELIPTEGPTFPDYGLKAWAILLGHFMANVSV
jgi:hypothetical protein